MRTVAACGVTGWALAACLACAPAPRSTAAPVGDDAISPVTLGNQTRPALPAHGSGTWRLAMRLPRGALVLASGSEERGRPWSLETTFVGPDGPARLSKRGFDGADPGWVEWTVPIPESLAGAEGELIVELEGGRDGAVAVARPIAIGERSFRPNVILISIDTLRADRLGCYGNPRATSPAIDRLASSGIRCRSVVAPSNWTLPSHYSMMTSLYPSVHGVHPDRAVFGGFRRPTHVAAVRGSGREETIAERMAALGYLAAAITEDGWVHPEFGFDQGFASYVADTSGSLAKTRERTLSWLVEHAGMPFFLFVHTYEPHQPYDLAPPYDALFVEREHVGYALPGSVAPLEVLEDFQPGFFEPMLSDVEAFRALYDSEIRYVDEFMADLTRTLDEQGIADRTVVVFTSDHGEEIFEHGRFSHGDALYDEVMRVPLILWGAGIPAGVVIDEPVSLLDVLPTIVEIAGGEVEEPVQGWSLVPRFEGPLEGLGNRLLFAEGSGKDSSTMVAVWRGDDKLIATGPPGAEELFDLRLDPHERHDLSSAKPATAAELRSLIESWRRENHDLGTLFDSHPGEIDETVIERLRALGYLD